jgi:hypothetical protein
VLINKKGVAGEKYNADNPRAYRLGFDYLPIRGAAGHFLLNHARIEIRARGALG